ncbi:MAG TPA: FHA domain-containing protein [Thermoanaerobaculia bacterium]|nr:FHA domain-containing protein [Thermoanaerobaculia bacterium]
MELKIQHLTGSRTGQEAVYEQDSVLLGRNPSSTITFDPYKDILVSGRHAEIVREADRWAVQDLGSTNGTFVDGEKVSNRRLLHPGDVIELGRGGPRIRVEWGSATVVAPLPVASAGPQVVEGKTVMMSFQQPAAEGAGPIRPTGRVAATKGRKPRRLLLIALLLFGVLMIGLVGAAVLVRQRNLATKRSEPKTTVATTETPAPPPPAAQQAMAESAEIRQALEEQAAEAARLQQIAASGEEGEGSDDLERQVLESQRMIEELTRELQRKNDELSSSRNRVSRPAPPRPRPQTPVPAPQVTETAATEAPRPVTQEPSPSLINVKFLRKPISITSLKPEIRTSQMSSGIEREMAASLSTSLLSTGKYVSSSRAPIGAISIAVTNYAVEQSTVDTKKVTKTVGAITGLLGEKVDASPLNVKSASWSADMAARVTLLDSVGRQIAQVQPSAQSRDRKTSLNLSSLTFGDLFRSDSPAGDVARKVVADAVEQMMPHIDRLEWLGSVTAHSGTQVLLDCGRVCQVEEGDFFDVMGGQTVIGRVKVVAIEETSSTAQVINGAGKMTGKSIRYAGRETRSTAYGATPKIRQLVLRRKAAVFDGPGNSFQKIRDLRSGTRLTYLYSVGFWARGTDGKTSYWVPIVHAEITE